jgi:hypothetical protein
MEALMKNFHLAVDSQGQPGVRLAAHIPVHATTRRIGGKEVKKLEMVPLICLSQLYTI